MMETSVRQFVDRYAAAFNRALEDKADMEEVAALYASDFVAASPAGVMSGKNDEQLKAAMAEGYARYRAMGTKAMRVRDVRVTPLDALHCVAHVAWTAVYARNDASDLAIDFDVHYFVQMLGREPRVFGWVSGDEEALLREHGIL